MKILDATCGTKDMWYQKNHPYVIFMDKRKGTFYYKYPNSPKKVEYHVEPDVVSEWKDAPFPDNYFDMIVFDPPHIIQNSTKGSMPTKYTILNPNNWQMVLKEGIKKLFDILKPDGIFIFKWCETEKFPHPVSIDNVLKLFPYKPLFGSNSKSKRKNSANIYWIVFLKYKENKELDIN